MKQGGLVKRQKSKDTIPEVTDMPLFDKLQAESMDISDVFENEPPQLDFVWPGFLAESVGALCAAGSTGKSFWALEAAMCVASSLANDQLLKLDIERHGKVLLLSAEDGLAVLKRRIYFIGSHMSPKARKEVSESLKVVPVVGWGVNITDSTWTDAIIRMAKGTRLVVLDTHSRWSGGANENDNAEQAGVVKQYEFVSAKAQTAVLFLHHVGKQAMFDGKQGEQGAARGASAITDNARWQGYMQTMTKDAAQENGVDPSERSFYVAYGSGKQNHGIKIDAPFWYRRHAEGVLLPVTFRKGSGKPSSTAPNYRRKPQAIEGVDVPHGTLENVVRNHSTDVAAAAVLLAAHPMSRFGG